MKTFMVEIPDDVHPVHAGVYLGDVLDYEMPEYFDFREMQVGSGMDCVFYNGRRGRLSRLTENAWMLKVEEKTNENTIGDTLSGNDAHPVHAEPDGTQKNG